MNHKNLTLALAMLISIVASPVFAQTSEPDEGESLYLYTKSSSEAVFYPMNELRKITFSKKGVQMWNTNWPMEYAYSQFRVITVKSKKDATGIESLTIGWGDGDGATYYDLQGRKVTSPRRGVYIMRSADGTTRKVLIK